MSGTKSSIDAYIDLRDAILGQSRTLVAEDIELLLDLMKEELLVSGCSPLIAAAYKSCGPTFYKYSPEFFSWSVTAVPRVDVPLFDAYWLIFLLAKYLSNISIAEEVKQKLPFFIKKTGGKKVSKDGLSQALKVIDVGVQKHRREMYDVFSSNDAAKDGGENCEKVAPAEAVEPLSALGGLRKETDSRADDVRQEVSVDKGDKDSTVIKQAEDQARQILQDARIQTPKDLEGSQKMVEEQARQTLERAAAQAQKIERDANKRAQEIIGRASSEADKKMSEAKKRFAEVVKECKSQAFDKEAEGVQKYFLDVRAALQEANEKIRKLEDSFFETTTKKVSAQFLELFNLIADAKDSAFDLARQNNDRDLENAAYNMDAFLDMIVEYMADYGIQPIATAPNSRFSAKCHTPVNATPQFDPRTAVVKVSTRSGFAWGEQVLQKERVEI